MPKISRSQRKAGDLKLGRISSNSNKNLFYLHPQDLRKHIFINGLTGMGKSNFAQNLLIEISKKYKKIPFLLIEFKGEYITLLDYIPNLKFITPGKDFSINIFDPRSEDPKIYAEKLMNLFTSCQIVTFNEDFSAQMEKILVEILENVCSDQNRQNWEGFDYYSAKIQKKYKNLMGNVNQTLMSIENRLRRIKNGSLKSIFDTNSELSIDQLINSSTVLDLGSIINLGGTKNDAIFFANVIFNSIWLNNLKNGKCDSIKHFTIIEDSQYFISQKFVNNQVNTNYIEDIALLLRGTGECLITINTRPNISEDIMANAGVIISFQSSYDQEKIGKLLSLKDSKIGYLTKLDVGECIIKVNSIPTPFVLQTSQIKRTYSRRDLAKKKKTFLKNILKRISSNLRTYLINIFKERGYIENKLQNNILNNMYIDSHKNSKKEVQNNSFLADINEKKKDIFGDIIKIKKVKLEKNIGTNKDFNEHDSLNNNKNYFAVSEWNDLLKSAENLFLIDQPYFSFLKCEDLYKSIINLLSAKWNISFSENKINSNFVENLNKTSADLSNTINEIEFLRNNSNSSEIKEYNVEKYLSLLKRIFLLIKIKRKNTILKKQKKNEVISRKNEIKEEDIWKILRATIIKFIEHNNL